MNASNTIAHRSSLIAHRDSVLKFLKLLSAIFFSLIFLNSFANFYSGLPSNVSDTDKATNFHYPANAQFSFLTEGFSRGKFNNEGYNNLFDYESGMSIDILLMGSSHMQAMEVMPEDNAANVLSKLSGKKVYNIGIRGHDFAINANNFENAVKKYKPSSFVVIEVGGVTFTDEELNQILSHNVPERNTFSQANLRAGGLRGFYAKYLREFIHENFFPLFSMIVIRVKNFFPDDTTEQSSSTQTNPVLLSRVLSRLAEVAKASGAKIIIAYHPAISLLKDGSLRIESDFDSVKVFEDVCKINGIYFLDTGERFLSEYERNYTLPYGFFNSSIAKGHMNKAGHKIFAEEIFKLMK